MLPITCTIIARDEADRIEQAITSVSALVDEVLVVDSGSKDDTVALCERLGARVIFNPWKGFGPQKRFAEDHARNDWILNLDADEWLSPILQAELAELLGHPGVPASRAYRMRTRIVYPGRNLPHAFADNHHYVRLYNRTTARFRDSLAHDEVVSSGEVVNLRGEILHRSFRSIGHIVTKMVFYSEMQKAEGLTPGPVPLWRLVIEMPFQFVKYYVLRRYMFGGRAGFCYALTFAFMRWLRLLIRSGL